MTNHTPPTSSVIITDPLVAELVEAWNAHDLDRILACYASDFEGDDVAQPTPQRGPNDMRRVNTIWLRAFPDMRLTADNFVSDGDQRVLVWHWEGTHRGMIMNIPPTGRVVQVRGVSVFTLENGLIRRGQRIWDLAGLLRGLGLLPEL